LAILCLKLIRPGYQIVEAKIITGLLTFIGCFGKV
jgi:hypothetical protein